jgi:hypothetical protein
MTRMNADSIQRKAAEGVTLILREAKLTCPNGAKEIGPELERSIYTRLFISKPTPMRVAFVPSFTNPHER